MRCDELYLARFLIRTSPLHDNIRFIDSNNIVIRKPDYFIDLTSFSSLIFSDIESI